MTRLQILLGMILLMTATWALPAEPVQEPTGVTPQKREMVVLLHGLGRSSTAMWLLAARLENAGFIVERVGYSSLRRSPQEIIAEATRQIQDCCANHAPRLHFVGHSLGGLVIRAYLQDNRVAHLGRVVLIGTPNQGTALVDRFQDHCLFELLGPTTNALGTDGESLPSLLAAPHYPVGVIAGVVDRPFNEPLLPGPDDGLVPVESTKLEGMSDFVLVEAGHSALRYNEEVANQVIAFLKRGEFDGPASVPAGGD
jgi:pimeloyl-ACP methyl ester carboxylesterase